MEEKISLLLKLTIPTLVIASLTYELNYFWGMGLSINSTPLEVSDLLRSWIEWGSIFLSASLAYLLLETFLKRAENWRSEDQIINSTNNPELTRKFREYSWRTMKFFAYLTLLIFILFGEDYLMKSIIGFYALGHSFILWVTEKSPVDHNRSLIRLLTFSTFFVIYFSIKGFSDGKAILDNQPAIDSQIEIKNKNYEVIRIFNNWSLLRINLNELGWIHHQSDRTIKVKISRDRFIGVAPYILKKNFSKDI